MRVTNKIAYLMATFVIVVWGITFVNTKLLLNYGFSPADVAFYRSCFAWVALWIICPKPLFAKSVKDELFLVLCGFMGGAAYFLLENSALKYSQAANVALIVNAAPVLTAILTMIVTKNILKAKSFWFGSIVALCGVTCVVFNDGFNFEIHFLGDMLALLSGVAWAVYSVTTKGFTSKYDVKFITRKVVFYTIVCISPYFIFNPLLTDFSIVFSPYSLANLLFLGVGAQTICFCLWTTCFKVLGAVKTNTFMYGSPIITLITAYLVLNEVITWIGALGCILILAGVYTCNQAMIKE